MYMLRPIMALFFISMTFAGCLKGADEVNCDYNACGFVAPAAEIAEVQNYLASNNIVAQQHCSGLFYVINTPGTGATANICSFITINYSGSLTNGNTFNQTTSPVSFRLSDLITGWKNGIPLIKQGGNITLYVPPSLAYGDQERRDQAGNVIIPANSMLIFTIDLVAVQ